MTSEIRARPRRPARFSAAIRRARVKARDLLSSPNALAAAAVVAVVALVLALYVVFAQVNLTNCLARYNEASAKATAARAMAASEDRATDNQERDLAETERARQAENDKALDHVLIMMGRRDQDADTRKALEDAFVNLLSVRNESARVRAANEVKRAQLTQQRAATEQRRAQNPIPDPPSTMCGGRSDKR